MGFVDDVMKVLDRIPGWKRLQEVPAEVDELKAKVAALEEMLGGKWPADVCKYCGERALRLGSTSGGADAKGNLKQQWHCSQAVGSIVSIKAAMHERRHRHRRPMLNLLRLARRRPRRAPKGCLRHWLRADGAKGSLRLLPDGILAGHRCRLRRSGRIRSLPRSSPPRAMQTTSKPSPWA
jgi:hypothetical protein